MDCERHEAALIDAAAGAPETPELQAHLRECAACRARLAEKRRGLLEIETRLAEALRIGPSLGFDARLRVHLSGEAARRPRLAAWPMVSAAAALVVVALGWSVLDRGGRVDPAARRTDADARVAAPTPLEMPPVVRGAVRTAPGVPASSAGRRQRPAMEPKPPRLAFREPEVLVPPGQEEAFARFVAALRARRVDPRSPLASRIPLESPLPDPDPVEIAPVELRPVAEDGISEGGSGS